MAIVRLSGGSSVTRASGYAKSLMVQEFALVTLDMISANIECFAVADNWSVHSSYRQYCNSCRYYSGVTPQTLQPIKNLWRIRPQTLGGAYSEGNTRGRCPPFPQLGGKKDCDMGCVLPARMTLSGLKFGGYVWYVYGITSITYAPVLH